MIVLNMFSGPGAGKSTISAEVFAHLKKLGVRTELVGEEAKDLIYWGADIQLSNQVYLLAAQYARLKNLERKGTQVAVADSPMLLSLVYAKHNKCRYLKELEALAHKLNKEFKNFNVFIGRNKPYQAHARQQTFAQAKQVDNAVLDAFDQSFERMFFSDEGHLVSEYIEDKLKKKGIL